MTTSPAGTQDAAHVALLPAGAAADRHLVERLTDLVNAAYERGERGLWRPGTARIFGDEVAASIAAGELAVARVGTEVAGCVRVRRHDASTGELGLLATDERHRGAGIGGELLRFAEALSRDRGAARMRLELLVPRAGEHPFKARLDAWYRRLGYRVGGEEDFAVRHPEPAGHLARPCLLRIYERSLDAPG